MSEPKAEQTSSEPGSVGAGPAAPHAPDAQSQPVTASAQESVTGAMQASPTASTEVESPTLAPEPEQDKTGEAPEVVASKSEALKADAPKAEAPKVEAATADAPRIPGRIMIMSSGDRAWDRNDALGAEPKAEPGAGMFGKRRLAALAAVVVLAVLAGAVGGALATVGLQRVVADDAAASGNRALEASVARIDADIVALKASVEHTSKLGMAQFNKASDRLDKVEKAQAEPAAKLAKLSEAVDKLRAAPQVSPAPVAATPVAAKEVTGSIARQATTPTAAPKAEVARLPTVEGWVLHDVANGGALIEGRQGMYEVYAGDPVPGLGRVDAIRRQDGRWVVVTSKGLIVAR